MFLYTTCQIQLIKQLDFYIAYDPALFLIRFLFKKSALLRYNIVPIDTLREKHNRWYFRTKKSFRVLKLSTLPSKIV